MESFEVILSAGGHANSLGRSGEVLTAVKADSTRLKELFDCISADDAWVRMRAVDTFEKLVKDTPEVAQPYLRSLLDDMTKRDQPSIQWHLAQIFGEVTLNKDDRAIAIWWLKDRISSTNVDWIVSVNCMKTLLLFHSQGYINAGELLPLFKIQMDHASKSVRKKAELFIKELQ